MPAAPMDPVDEELRRVLADPGVRANLDAYLERKRRGELGPGIPHEEVGRRLGLLGDDESAANAWRGDMAGTMRDDRDVRWLLDLLTLLPAMTADIPRDVVREREVHPALDVAEVEKEAAEWWDRFGELHPDRIDRGRYPRIHLLPYALRILEGKADDEDVRSLAQYCLLLFDVADLPECCEHLDVVVQSHIPQRGRAGRRWAESVTEVAWRLYVPRQARGRLREGLAAWPGPPES